MRISFHKYQGTGNDFVIIDDRSDQCSHLDSDRLKKLCDRRFGIGADGVIFLREHPHSDFEMVYFNSDGHASSMCGNGGRCIVEFARTLGLIERDCKFQAVDGLHHATFEGEEVVLKMGDVEEVTTRNSAFVLDTGSPHYVTFLEGVQDLDVDSEGLKIRDSEEFREQGINVNFVESRGEDQLLVRTRERGVEAETLSCGTGVTAAAISWAIKNKHEGGNQIRVESPGGSLEVRFFLKDHQATDVWLKGKATFVYSGEIEI